MPADEINQGEYNGTRKNAWKIITKTEATPQLNLTWPSNQFAEASLTLSAPAPWDVIDSQGGFKVPGFVKPL